MNTKDLTPHQMISIGRGIACKYLPFISTAIYALIPEENSKEPTLSVTKRMVMSFNPHFVKELGPKGTAAVIVHEVSHVLRNHHERFERIRQRMARRFKTGGTTRRRSSDLFRLWNLSADAEINDGQPPQLPLPPGCIYPSTFGLPNGKLAEWYFAKLLEQQEQGQEGSQGQQGQEGQEDQEDSSQGQQGQQNQQDQQGGSQGQDGQQNQQDQQGGSQGQDGQQDQQDHQGGSQGQEEGQEDPGPGCGSCGSCAGPAKAHEAPDGKLDGELGRSDAEMGRIRDQVAREAIEHFQKHAGRGSASWMWWAKQRLKPPVIRWQEQLDVLTRQAVAFREGFVDWRDDLVDEQQGCLGWGPNIPLLPRLVAPTPEVMFLVDRSGSMTGNELTEVAQEVPGVLQHLTTPLQFGSFDDTLKEIKRVNSVQEALKLFKGGGGTDFRPIFEYLKKPGVKKPDVLIIGTDGCGPAPAAPPPGISVIWLLVGKRACKPCNWGKFIWTDLAKRAKAA